MEDVFYTLTGYKNMEDKVLTNAMEDYLEMIYRISLDHDRVQMKDLANRLHVRASSVTKMMNRLKELKFVKFEKYGDVFLTKKGSTWGKYLLYRHEVLVCFFKALNGKDYSLEQVEKIEHFVDMVTITNMKKHIKK